MFFCKLNNLTFYPSQDNQRIEFIQVYKTTVKTKKGNFALDYERCFISANNT